MNQISIPGTYEYLSHPADLKICAMGTSLEQALGNLIKAITATRDDFKQITSSIKANSILTSDIKVQIKSRRLTSLVYDLCQHYLELLEVKTLLAIDLKNAKISSTKSGFSLDATLICVKLNNDQVLNLIKAPTYHEMDISTQQDITKVTIVLDI